MGHSVTEIGHPPPHDEATKRARGQCQTYPGNQRAGEKIVKHGVCLPHDGDDVHRHDDDHLRRGSDLLLCHQRA